MAEAPSFEALLHSLIAPAMMATSGKYTFRINWGYMPKVNLAALDVAEANKQMGNPTDVSELKLAKVIALKKDYTIWRNAHIGAQKHTPIEAIKNCVAQVRDIHSSLLTQNRVILSFENISLKMLYFYSQVEEKYKKACCVKVGGQQGMNNFLHSMILCVGNQLRKHGGASDCSQLFWTANRLEHFIGTHTIMR